MSRFEDMKIRMKVHRVKHIEFVGEGAQQPYMDTLYIYRMNDGSYRAGNGDLRIPVTSDEAFELAGIVGR